MPPAELDAIKMRMDTLFVSYLLKLSDTIKSLEIYSENGRLGQVSDQEQQSFRTTFHQLSGNAGTYGLPEISVLARVLDQWLQSAIAIPHQQLSERISQFCRQSKEIIKQHKPTPLLNRASSPPNDTTPRTAKKLPTLVAVDDDPMIRLAVTQLLSDDANIVLGESTQDAERLMRTLKPSLVLLDDIMPGGITGLTFLEKAQKDPELSSTPIIMLTASDKKEEVMRGLAAGAHDYITKPFTPENLRTTVKNFLKRAPNTIALNIADNKLSAALSDRLTQLGCFVHMLHGINDSAVWQTIGSDFAVIVCMQKNQNLDETRNLAQQKPQCHFLLMTDEREPAPRLQNITVIPQTDQEEEILKHIAQILAHSRRTTERASTGA